MSGSQTRRAAAIAAAVLAAASASAVPAATAATLSKQQVKSLKKACGYFPSDYEGLVGELKMANLTGAVFISGTRYVAADLQAVAPTLDAAQKAQLARARKVLAQMAASTPKRPVSSSEKNRVGKRFRSAPFPTLSKAVQIGCGYLAKHGSR
jgi:hypothetical protein